MAHEHIIPLLKALVTKVVKGKKEGRGSGCDDDSGGGNGGTNTYSDTYTDTDTDTNLAIKAVHTLRLLGENFIFLQGQSIATLFSKEKSLFDDNQLYSTTHRVPRLTHASSFPYCYYNKYQEKIRIRVVSSPDVLSVLLFHGDPYECIQCSGEGGGEGKWVWKYEEITVCLHSAGQEQKVWCIDLDVPVWKRLRYAFRIESDRKLYYFCDRGLFPWKAGITAQPHQHFVFPYVHAVDAAEVPAWVASTVWYQIFPERFCNGNPAITPVGAADWEKDEPARRNFFGGDLEGIRLKLGYLKGLGVNGLYLTPVFKAPSNHKYDTQDYFSIDESFGNLDDLKRLTAEAHGLGMRVMLDAVFNHVGERHAFWQDVLKNQEQSTYRDYFHIRRFPVRERFAEEEVIDYETFAFVSDMPKWNTENSEVRAYLLEAALYWIREADIDGWRLDVANEVSLDFWRVFSRRVREMKKDFYIVGEIWHDASPWINSFLFDATMNYPLGFAIQDFLLRKSIGAEEFTTRIVASLSRYSDLHNTVAFNLLDSHDTVRALTTAGGDRLALRNAFTFLLLLPGSPCLYYGTEVGMDGGDDPQNRRPMVWSKDRQDQNLLAFFQKLIAFRLAHADFINTTGIFCRDLNSGWLWTLSSNTGEEISIVYAKDTPVSVGSTLVLGDKVFCTAETSSSDTESACLDDIPPFSIGVYHRVKN